MQDGFENPNHRTFLTTNDLHYGPPWVSRRNKENQRQNRNQRNLRIPQINTKYSWEVRRMEDTRFSFFKYITVENNSTITAFTDHLSSWSLREQNLI